MTLITYFLGYHRAKHTPLGLTKRIFSNDLREQIAKNLGKVIQNLYKVIQTLTINFWI